MNYKDIYISLVVYHSIFPHWGKGEVVEIRQKDIFGYRTSKRVKVRWEGRTGKKDVWCRLSEIRKTPNKKKIKLLKEIKDGKRQF